MKKSLLLLFSLSALSVSAQQHVFDFEDLTIPANSFVNVTGQNFGTDLVTFYGPASDYGFGIGYSNQTDMTKADFTNSGSAYNTNAQSPTSNFGIIFDNGAKITFAKPIRLQSIDLTNNSYAYLVIKNGNDFSKKFGGLDGTVADSFAVILKAFDEADKLIDSVSFNLADFTSSVSSEDFIIEKWTTLSLASLKDSVSSIKFYFASTDKNSYGILTPAYVAIDNLTFSEYIPTADELLSSANTLTVQNGSVSLAGAVSISLYTANGVLIAQGTDSVAGQGAYIAVAVAADGSVISQPVFID